jgi:transposase-like protein
LLPGGADQFPGGTFPLWTSAFHGARKYLNNIVEQDHRRVKQRLGPMLRLKGFGTAAVVIGGIELAARIKKGQFVRLGGRTARMPEIWQAALAA